MRYLVSMLFLTLLAAGLVAASAVRDYREFAESALAMGGAAHVLLIEPGASYRDVVTQLRREGLTRAPDIYWRVLAWQQGVAERIQAGEYRITSSITPSELLELLASGDVYLHPFTIVEGWTVRQLRAALNSSEVIRATLTTHSDEQIMSLLGHPGMHPEGRFLPETYHFPRGATDLTILRRAAGAMNAALEQVWEQRDPGLPYETADDVLVMASIIEKETAVAAEREHIAGVFVRRLQKRMRLQSDPTVIYGMGVDFDGNIRSEDLRRDTPYNTYTRHGLPPTPIALPGKAALKAAVHPAPGKTLYFVATGDGAHVFAETLEEHNSNVARYQRNRRGSR